MCYRILNEADITKCNKFLLFYSVSKKESSNSHKKNKCNIVGTSHQQQSIKELPKFYFKWPGSYLHAASDPSILYASCNTQHIRTESEPFLMLVWKVFVLASRPAPPPHPPSQKNQRTETGLCEDPCEVHFGQLLLNVLNVPSTNAKHTKFSRGLTTCTISSAYWQW